MPRRPTTASNSPLALWPIALIFALLILTLWLIRYYQDRHQPTPPPSIPTTSAPSTPSAPTLPETTNNNLIYGGPPLSTSPDSQYHLLTNTGYCVGYSETYKDPVWVAYRLFAVDHFTHYPRPRRFEPDPRTTAQITHDDYDRCGFDRGHMAPNFAIMKHYGQLAQNETFLMSNVVPQTHHLNAGPWEALEKLESESYAETYHEIWILDGPIFPQPPAIQRLSTGPAIPTHTWKILIRKENGHLLALAVNMPQTVNPSDNPANFLTPISSIETQTHLHFFPSLPPQLHDALAKTTAPLWP